MKHVQTYARKHKLSFIPGGHTVVITEFSDAVEIQNSLEFETVIVPMSELK